jgi:hypothetical protein
MIERSEKCRDVLRKEEILAGTFQVYKFRLCARRYVLMPGAGSGMTSKKNSFENTTFGARKFLKLLGTW